MATFPQAIGPTQGAQETIVSSYDLDARRAQKRDTFWCGYKVHVQGVPRGSTWVPHLARLKRRREQEQAAG